MCKLSLHEMRVTLEALTGVRGEQLSSTSYRFHCPAHADNTPSLVVSDVNGKVLLHCFAGCSYESILQTIDSGVMLYTLDSVTEETPLYKRKIIKKYKYHDENGKYLYEKVKFNPKSFAIRHKKGRRYKWGLGDNTKVLYNLHLLQTDTIAIVEGEKDADNLTALGIVSTCNIEGGGKWCKEYNKYFVGKDVLLFTDNDETGLQRLETLKENLVSVVRTLKIIHPLPGLSRKGDVSDYILLGGSLEELQEIITKTPCYAKQ